MADEMVGYGVNTHSEYGGMLEELLADLRMASIQMMNCSYTLGVFGH